MDLQQFLSRPAGSFPRAFKSRHFSQDLSDEVRELARQGLKLFPVSLAAHLNDCPDELISAATCDISLLEELSAAAQPLWGFRLALGPSGLCVLILNGAVGKASFAALVPDLEGCSTLQARRGDLVYAFFRQPAGMKRIAGARKLAPGVRIILGDCESSIVPPAGGAVWLNYPGAEIETLSCPTTRIPRRDAQFRRPSLLPVRHRAGPPSAPRSRTRRRGKVTLFTARRPGAHTVSAAGGNWLTNVRQSGEAPDTLWRWRFIPSG